MGNPSPIVPPSDPAGIYQTIGYIFSGEDRLSNTLVGIEDNIDRIEASLGKNLEDITATVAAFTAKSGDAFTDLAGNIKDGADLAGKAAKELVGAGTQRLDLFEPLELPDPDEADKAADAIERLKREIEALKKAQQQPGGKGAKSKLDDMYGDSAADRMSRELEGLRRNAKEAGIDFTKLFDSFKNIHGPDVALLDVVKLVREMAPSADVTAESVRSLAKDIVDFNEGLIKSGETVADLTKGLDDIQNAAGPKTASMSIRKDLLSSLESVQKSAEASNIDFEALYASVSRLGGNASLTDVVKLVREMAPSADVTAESVRSLAKEVMDFDKEARKANIDVGGLHEELDYLQKSASAKPQGGLMGMLDKLDGYQKSGGIGAGIFKSMFEGVDKLASANPAVKGILIAITAIKEVMGYFEPLTRPFTEAWQTFSDIVGNVLAPLREVLQELAFSFGFEAQQRIAPFIKMFSEFVHTAGMAVLQFIEMSGVVDIAVDALHGLGTMFTHTAVLVESFFRRFGPDGELTGFWHFVDMIALGAEQMGLFSDKSAALNVIFMAMDMSLGAVARSLDKIMTTMELFINPKGFVKRKFGIDVNPGFFETLGEVLGAPQLKYLDGMATGGFVEHEKVTRIGEAGPEAVVPLTDEGVARFVAPVVDRIMPDVSLEETNSILERIERLLSGAGEIRVRGMGGKRRDTDELAGAIGMRGLS